MERTERILDLVALLLDARRPVSFEQIRDAFPGEYDGSHEAAMRKFERDKAELIELGIPLQFVNPTDNDEGQAGGYQLDREAYYLPELKLTPDELAVLYSAGSAALASGAFPGSGDLAYALRKIGFFSAAPLPAAKVRVDLQTIPQADGQLAGRLESLWRAIESRKRVTLEYFSPHTQQLTQRMVRPYGLALRRGVWTLVAHCELRNAIRTFIVHRIRSLTVNTQKPKAADFVVPTDFVLNDYVALWPWQYRIHEPIEVTVQLSGALVSQAHRLFPVTESSEPGPRTFSLKATDLQGLVRTVLSLGPEARVVAPDSAVVSFRGAAQRVASAHGVTS